MTKNLVKSVRVISDAVRNRGWRWTFIRLKEEFCAWKPRLCGKRQTPLYWFYSESSPNFGDVLNPWLYEKITGGAPVRVKAGCNKDHVLAIGTVLNKANSSSIVWGAGGHAKKAPKEILALRGPLSAASLARLNVPSPSIYGDPGLLVARYYVPRVVQATDFTLVPHLHDYKLVNSWYKTDREVRVLDLRSEVETILDQISSSSLVISSSLHGVVVSHSYGIPVAWAIFQNDLADQSPIGTDKFVDYFLGIGVSPPYYPVFFGNQKIAELAEIDWSRHVIPVPEGVVQRVQERLLRVCPFHDPAAERRTVGVAKEK